MKTWFGGAVALLGATVTICGGTALYNYAIIADETGISGCAERSISDTLERPNA